ncbi:hypothetical protein ACCT30_40880 [Rhizobium ruizarguesonis]|nr:hypothetical protein G7039_01500 [Rhizobium leguminosarum]
MTTALADAKWETVITLVYCALAGSTRSTAHNDMKGGVMNALFLIEANQSEKTFRLCFAVKISWASIVGFFS